MSGKKRTRFYSVSCRLDCRLVMGKVVVLLDVPEDTQRDVACNFTDFPRILSIEVDCCHEKKGLGAH